MCEVTDLKSNVGRMWEEIFRA